MAKERALFAVVVVGYVLAVTQAFPQFDYTSNRHASRIGQFICPKSGECSCNDMITEYELQCPPRNPQMLLRFQPIEAITSVQIECQSTDTTSYEAIPPVNVSGANTISIRRCPLPANGSLASVLRKMGVTGVQFLRFQTFGQELGSSMTKQHLEGLTELQRLLLSDNGLTELPDDIFENMVNLKFLNLGSNHIRLQSGMFQGLENLDFLELSFNGIVSIPQGTFQHLPNMRHLNLWSNRLQNLTKDAFVGAEAVIELDLSANQMETIDKDVFTRLPKLINLNLSANRFSTLPAGLFAANKQLTQFRFINNRVDLPELPDHLLADLPFLADVSIRCNLQRIPANLFRGSTNITKLALSPNLLEKLPENLLADQSQLIDLDLSDNRLNDLLDGLLTATTSLKVLRLSHNQLENITGRIFQHLPRLQELYLNNNRLRFIHQNAFISTRSIEILQLENNRLSFALDEIEIALDQLHQYNTPFQYLNEVRRLILRNNSITKIYSDWNMNNLLLQELDLSYNNITLLRDVDLQFLSEEIKLNLSHNNIAEVDFRELKHMIMSQDNLDTAPKVHVDLQANPLMCNCLLLDFVKYLQNEMPTGVKKVLDISVDSVRCAGPDGLLGRAVANVQKQELLCPLDSPSSAIQKCPRQCNCWVRIADMTLVVNCSNANLTQVPELPETTSLSALELYIQNNSITRLPVLGSPGYANVTKIFAQNNNITLLLRENIPAKLHTLDMTNNQISFINTTVLENLNATTQLQQIALSNNPWSCNCDSLDLLTFVQSRFQIISDFDTIQCAGGSTKLASMSPGQMCPTNQKLLIALCVSFTILVLLISITAILYYKYEQEVKVWMFAHNLCLWCISEEELDKDKKYDAFLSYSHKDEEIAKQLVNTLESGSNPHKLCIHDRDWTPGEWIQEQIAQSVENSRRTIVVLSPNFLESVWGKMEFRTAHQNAMSEGRARLIIIIYGDIGDTENLDAELKAYLKTNTYVKWGDKWFWEKLRYAMPHPMSLKGKGLIKNNMKSSVDDKLELIKPVPVTPPLTTPPAESAGNDKQLFPKNGKVAPMSDDKMKTNGLNGHINGAFIINTSAKQSDV